MRKSLFYYFAFPHYRAEIIKELNQQSGGTIMFASGTDGRDSIKPLTRKDIDFLTELESVDIGPFSWQKGIVRRAISREFDSVVLGPARLSLSTWMVLLGRRLLGRKTYLWGQCGRPGARTVRRYLQEIMNRAAHGLLVYGEAEASAATELGTSPNKVHVVNNATHRVDESFSTAIDQDIYQRLQHRTREAVEEHRLVLAYVGRMISLKKVEVLLEAARKMRSRYENLRVLIIGGGSQEERIRRDYPDSFIEYLGWIYDDAELNQVLEAATMIVSPNHLGLLAVDALRLGIPVLIPDNPQNASEVESLTEGVNSMRFAQGNSDAIVEAVDRWLQIAPQISEQEYVRARNTALRTWSPTSVAKKILDVINLDQ